MLLEGCSDQSGQQHLTHAVCFARDLSNLRTVSLTCKVCNIDSHVTIHDTQDEGDGFEELPDSVDDKELGLAATATLGHGTGAQLGSTNVLDQAIDEEDNELY